MNGVRGLLTLTTWGLRMECGRYWSLLLAKVNIFVFLSFLCVSEQYGASQAFTVNCPTWIRTMNKGSKGLCVTVTPSGKEPANISAERSSRNGKEASASL